MSDVNLPDYVHVWANDILTWVGFGTIVGLLAKAIMPGRDPGGSIATLGMGIGGTLIGCGVWSFFYNSRVTPISPMGFAVGTAGSFIILFFYKLLGGYWFIEGESPGRRYRHRRAAGYLRRSHHRPAANHFHED